MMQNIFLLLAIVLLINCGTGSHYYYISSSEGNDTNSGLSENTPWQSFANLESIELEPGDAVFLKCSDKWQEELNLRGKGTKDLPIVLSSYGKGGRPRILRKDFEYDYCILLENPSHWQISNLDCRNAKIGLYLRYYDSWGNENIIIENCYFENMPSQEIDVMKHNQEFAWSAGIFMGGRIIKDTLASSVLTNLTIRHCGFYKTGVGFINNWYWPEVYRQRLCSLVMENCWAEGCFGGGVAVNMASGVIRNNRFVNNGGYFQYGVTAGFAQSCENLIIENNEFGHTRRDNCPDGTGFDFEGDNRNCIFRNNYVHHNDGAGVLVMSTVNHNYNIQFSGNVFHNNCQNPLEPQYNYEFLCHNNGSTGEIFKNKIYRSNARDYFSHNWNNFQKKENDLKEKINDNIVPPYKWEESFLIKPE